MLTLWNQFDDLFGSDPFGRDDLWKWPARSGERKFLPAVDIRETKDGYVLTADIPGVPVEAIDISVKDGVLTLQGERTSESRTAEGGYQRVERSIGKFHRSFVLPKGVSSEGIEARVDHGVLTLSIPKPVAALPHKVEIKVGSGSEPAGANSERKVG